MNRGPSRALTGVDYEVARPRRQPRRLQWLLGLVAVAAFGSAWLLRDGGAAVANESGATAVAEPHALVASAAAGPAATTPIPLDRVLVEDEPTAAADARDGEEADDSEDGDAASQLAALSGAVTSAMTPKVASEAASVQVPAASTAEEPDEAEVDSLAEQIEKKPQRRQLTLPAGLKLKSSIVLVVDQNTQEVLAAQNADAVQPIASLTKLMTAMVVTDAKLPLDEVLEITRDDIDAEKHSYSRLSPGLKFTRRELLLLALMSSENRAASALGRNYPGGRPAFIRAMNAKAQALGMTHTHYADSSGLSSRNVSSAHDLVKLVDAAYKVPLIREYSTRVEHTVKPGRRSMHFVSSNRLVRAKNDWRIGLQKTGFTNEAGRCLVMQATVKGRSLVMVLLDSDGKFTRFADAQRVRNWVESGAKSKTASSKSGRSRSTS
ncbi:D-alanyl-D-alanine endopeptidase [Solimonas flava]|uniref:D-alanyl-D-alanine endopeptidase n=1 Tax=Solimonas flava TaxID=415849 RepID=UPI00041AE387|nr:D-alanyl-D-alanine endopeptidase [Solimonas flava]